jgi:pyridoxal 5'-phosphate synthase pdxS subunit
MSGNLNMSGSSANVILGSNYLSGDGGDEGVFVGSGIFKSGNPQKRADAIVKAVTNFNDPKLLAEISEDLGEAMVGINEQEIELLMAERGK